MSGIVFACVFGGAVLGMLLRNALPEHHLSAESKDIVKLSMGLVGTMAALVIGLLTASAKGSFEAQRGEFMQMSAEIILLDRVLANYGPETKDARDLLRRQVVSLLDRMEPEKGYRSSKSEPMPTSEPLYDNIQHLSPLNEEQRDLRANALRISVGIAQTRWLMFSQQRDSSLPMPFLVVLVFWLTIILGSFGLFAPSNATVLAALFICALSVSGAIFLILELDTPLDGVVRFKTTPLRNALTILGH
jgi:hypothetical protein